MSSNFFGLDERSDGNRFERVESLVLNLGKDLANPAGVRQIAILPFIQKQTTPARVRQRPLELL
jgi:hypothetical protein